jgi:GNAT superfamily N-acetyltransferase
MPRCFLSRKGPPVPEEAPVEKLTTSLGCTILLLPAPSGAIVEARSLEPGGVERSVDAVRELLRERNKASTAWWVSESAEPDGLVTELLRLGLEPYDEPPFEPRFAAMVRMEPPAPGPDDVGPRPAETFDEYIASVRLRDAVFDLSEEDRRAWEASERVSFELQLSGKSPTRSFVALVGGEVVGFAAMVAGAAAVNLIGGSVREDMRGRGVYRALVRARWDHAVARGTPALTVQAGHLSRPILEKLGFEVVGWEDCLLDRLSG